MNQWLRRLDLRRNRALLLQAALLLVPPEIGRASCRERV